MQTISQTAARQSDRQTEDKVNLLPDLEELQEDIKFVLPRFVVKPTANTHPFEHRASICFLKILAIFAPAQVSVSFSLSLSLYRSRCRILGGSISALAARSDKRAPVPACVPRAIPMAA